MTEVSYKPLGDALDRLAEALHRWQALRNGDLQIMARDSVLVSFQFTFALIRPMLERYLIRDGDDPQLIKEASFPALIRSANDRRLLLEPWSTWNDFREARNRVAHTYNEASSEAIAVVVPAFYDEAKFLYQQLTDRSTQ